jgi:hypothetical protein
MVPSECSVLASKAKPICLTFDGLASTRFLSHKPKQDKKRTGSTDKTRPRSASPQEHNLYSDDERSSGDSSKSWKGYVYKSGAGTEIFGVNFNRIKKRWTEIRDGQLKWYLHENEKKKKGELCLREYSVKQMKEDSRYGYGVMLKPANNDGRRMRLYVESLAMRKNLIEALAGEIQKFEDLDVAHGGSGGLSSLNYDLLRMQTAT